MDKSSRTHSAPPAELAPLTGGMLVAAALVLASANFIAVLDTTIANVSVPNIAGGLGATSSQGTYVITSYAVAEAITVPLTGWLAGRFGAVRVFVTAMILFGLFSALCGLAHLTEHAGVVPYFSGAGRRPADAALPDLVTAHLPQGESRGRHRLMEHDHAGRADPGSYSGRHAVR